MRHKTIDSFRFITWNAVKRSPKHALAVIKSLTEVSNSLTVAALQEIPRWLPAAAAKSKYLLVINSSADCGVLLPKSWEPLIRKVIIRPYWTAVVVGKFVFASAHLLWDKSQQQADPARDEPLSAAEEVLHEFNDFKQSLVDVNCEDISSNSLTEFIGVDANLSLWQNPWMESVGTSVFRKTSGTQTSKRIFSSWLSSHHYVCSNSWSQQDHKEAWTREAKRRKTTAPVQRSQIDYIITKQPHVEHICTRVCHEWQRDPWLSTSDHAPVEGEVAGLPQNICVPRDPPSMKGWQPRDSEAEA